MREVILLLVCITVGYAQIFFIIVFANVIPIFFYPE